MSKDDFRYEIKEILGVASPQEDTSRTWIKAVLSTLKGEEQEFGIDIRNFNFATSRMSSGIRLTPQEANNVCNILMEHGYGSIEIMERKLAERKGAFSKGGDTGV